MAVDDVLVLCLFNEEHGQAFWNWNPNDFCYLDPRF